MISKNLGTIAWVTDERLPREKVNILTQLVTQLRKVSTVQVMDGANTTEDTLLAKLKEGMPYSLILVPWDRYLKWKRVDGALGLTRLSGPTFVGYTCSPLQAKDLKDIPGRRRTLLLDLHRTSLIEALPWIAALAQEQDRSGVRPLCEPSTCIYVAGSNPRQTASEWSESILSLSETQAGPIAWSTRAASIRAVCLALSGFFQAGKGFFSVAVDPNYLLLRLCTSVPGKKLHEIFDLFYPNAATPSHPAQMLVQYSDFVRVLSVGETSDLEIVAGLTRTASSETHPKEIRTLWMEPLAAHLFTEDPTAMPGPDFPHLKPLPIVTSAAPAVTSDTDPKKDRFLIEAAAQIKKLRTELKEKTDMLDEILLGGVGSKQDMRPPEAEELLEAFQERYFSAQFDIRQLEREIQALQNQPQEAQSQKASALQTKMHSLIQREMEWMKQLFAIIQDFKKTNEAYTRKKG